MGSEFAVFGLMAAMAFGWIRLRRSRAKRAEAERK
jgi:hypothetical protein